MAKGFTPPKPGKSSGYTELERQAIEAAREGKQLRPVEKEQEDGSKIVTLEEFTEEIGSPTLEMETPQNLTQDKDAGSEAADRESSNFMDVVFGKEEEKEPEEEAGPASEIKTNTMGEIGETFCPRCGWDLDIPVIYEPTEEDKFEFVRSVLGNRRFRKSVGFFNDKVKITYRSMTNHEVDMIQRRQIKDVNGDKYYTQADIALKWREYQLVFMLESISTADESKTRTFPVPDFSDLVDMDQKIKRLEKLRVELFGDFPSQIGGILMQGVSEVHYIYSAMGTRSRDSDFWETIQAEDFLERSI